MEMLEHSNRRSRFSFFNIEMMETLRHRESTREGRRGDCPRGRRAGPEAAVLLSGGYPPSREAWRKRAGESRRQGEAPLAWRRRGRPPARRRAPISLLIYRKPGRPRLWAGAKRRDRGAERSASPQPPSLPLRRAGVVGILCAGGFPARAAPGARIIPNSPPRRAEARRAGRPAARGTAGKTF